MNILRWKRKSKKKINFRLLILVIFSLIMTTFAWFAYSRVLDPTLNIHMSSWDMEYYIGDEKQSNPIGINIPSLYPTMPEQTVEIDIKNNGETLVDIEYLIESITIAGVEYQVLSENATNTAENYIVITDPVKETQTITDDNGEKEIVVGKGVITNDITRFPFTIEVDYTTQVEASNQGYLTVRVNWIGDNAKLDSQWGYIVGQYFDENPTATSVISIGLRIDSYQTNLNAVPDNTITLPSTSETSPYLPTGFTRIPGTTLDNGLVIKDSTGNEYVWIEVPKTASVYPTAGLSLDLNNLSGDELTSAYNLIETDLNTYTAQYDDQQYETSDTYYSDDTTGLTSVEYTRLKQGMLKSVYQNGGFYIGRYEAGLEDTYRIAGGTANDIPLSKQNLYPYNWITCKQAQTVISFLSTSEYNASLMFGVQAKLVLKYIVESGSATQTEMVNDYLWGNTPLSVYDLINTKAYFYNPNQTTWSVGGSKIKDADGEKLLLTTGANSTFVKHNIYDLIGNLEEWTLEYSGSESQPCFAHGSTTAVSGVKKGVSEVTMYSGFRVTLWK